MESEQKTLRVKKDLSGTTYEEITTAQKKKGPPTRETLDYMFERRGGGGGGGNYGSIQVPLYSSLITTELPIKTTEIIRGHLACED